MRDHEEPLGLEYGELRLVRANPAWTTVAAELSARVREVLGSQVVEVEHVGSTSVPGLLCKPIIDLTAGFVDKPDMLVIEAALIDDGWIYRGDSGEDGGHLFVLEARPWFRVAHLHGVDHGGPQWNRYLEFRQRLRADAMARDTYEKTKLALLNKLGPHKSRAAYTEAKSTVVRSILFGAEARGGNP